VARYGALREAWRLYRSEWRRIVALSALAYAAIFALWAVLIGFLGPFGVPAALYLWVASIYWLQAPLARLIEDMRSGIGWRGARATLSSVFPRLGRISGASSLAALAVAPSMLFFPLALYLMTQWSLVVPVIAVENCGLFTAFSRSREIVRGHAWGIFGRIALSALLVVAIWIAILILTGLTVGLDPSGLGLVGFPLITVAVLSLTMPLIALTWTLTYYRLREQVPTEIVEARRLRTGRTLDRAWKLYKTHPARAIAVALPFAIGLTAAQVGVAMLTPYLAVPVTLAGYVLIGGVFAVALRDIEGGATGAWLRATGRRVLPRLPSLAVAATAIAAILTVSLPLLVGVFLLVRMSVAGAVAGVERVGAFAALRRSSRLVKGEGRRAVSVILVSIVMVLAVVLALLGLLPFTEPGPVSAFVLIAVANVVATPYVGLAWALMYRVLARLEHERAAAAPG
jgi:hypothetical protein